MTERHLIYFADPMCSWCYGFAPVIEAVRAEFGQALPIRLIMGGLRPGTDQPLSAHAAAEITSHWTQVAEASGQPFAMGVLHEGFVYDTDPAARAVVLVREHAPEAALSFLARVQQAFYAEAQNVTDLEVLGRLAAEFGFDAAAFTEALSDPNIEQQTWRDYAVSQRAGVTGFPTLVGGPGEDGQYGVVTRGFARGDQVLTVLREWLARTSA